MSRVLEVPDEVAKGIVTHIYSHNVDVDRENATRLDRLSGELMTYTAIDNGNNVQALKNCPALPILDLKIGAQVMLLRNMTVGNVINAGGVVPGIADPLFASPARLTELILGNGSVGKVVRFEPMGEPDSDDNTGGNDGDTPLNSTRLWPVVDFAKEGVILRVEPHRWEMRDTPTSPPSTSRIQVPLKLCWAFTVHKSQGQTITCPVVADLSNVFDYGQAYVTLSRVKSLDQLYLKPFDPAVAIRAHPAVVEYYNALEAVVAAREVIKG